ncbi:glycine/D-amino acid oxidase-like deaminating enzyme [Bradyrhizobium sp. LM6.10]
MRVVICGGGVIGACTAWFLRRRGIDVIVVERTDVAAAASGKAGGFLARNWCEGSPLDALARRSFAIHAQLPEEIAGDWGYRPMTAYSGFVAADGHPRRDAPSALGWLSNGVIIAQRIGTTETTAIVHPKKFTSAVMNAALAQGAELRSGNVAGIMRDADGTTATGVEVDGRTVEADAVVIAMGPWSLLAAQWMSLPAVFGQRSPSIVYDTGTDAPADALFLESEENGSAVSVEVFPRADGSTHITALRLRAASARSSRRDAGPRRDRAPANHVRAAVAAVPLREDHCAAGLLPAADTGRPAADRPGTAERRPLCCDRAQCVGHPECTRHGRGNGATDRRGCDAQRRHLALRSRAARAARSVAAASALSQRDGIAIQRSGCWAR